MAAAIHAACRAVRRESSARRMVKLVANLPGAAVLEVVAHVVIANARMRGAPMTYAFGCSPAAADAVQQYCAYSRLRALGRWLWAGCDERPVSGDVRVIVSRLPDCAPRLPRLHAMVFEAVILSTALFRAAMREGRQPTIGSSVTWAQLRASGRRHPSAADPSVERSGENDIDMELQRTICALRLPLAQDRESEVAQLPMRRVHRWNADNLEVAVGAALALRPPLDIGVLCTVFILIVHQSAFWKRARRQWRW